ncbi:hypothetical protein ACIHFD_49445 [Nonomuraea sp. NPDC051941]|uniref:hypothetical protein n=1 Tax=Nonomuraea sp. NPDC051941 TaxID=3364373 RepID=UPI0037C597CA
MNKQVAWWQIGLMLGILCGILAAAVIIEALGLDDKPDVVLAPDRSRPLLAAPTRGNNR